MRPFQLLVAIAVLTTGTEAADSVASLFGFYPGQSPSSTKINSNCSLISSESTNSSLFAHRTSFDYGFGTNLVPTNTCVSSNLVNNQVQFKIDGVKQIWGRFYAGDFNSAFCVMGYNGAECLEEYLQVMDNWISSNTCMSFQVFCLHILKTVVAIEEAEYGSPAAYNLTATTKSAKVVTVSDSILACLCI